MLAGVVPAVLSLGAVAAVVLLLIGVFGQSTGGSSAGVTPTVLPTTADTPSAATTSPTPTTPVATQRPTLTVPTEFPDIPVVVRNSTSAEGLATRVTAYLGELGWTMGGAGNFAPTLPTTTVYHPAGYEAAASELAAAAPGSGSTIAAVIPEVDAGAITVVLGADAVDWTAPEPSSP